MTPLVGLLVAAAAVAQDAEPRMAVSVEVGTLANPDPGYDLFSDSGFMASYGLKVGYRLSSWLEIDAGWHRTALGSVVRMPGPSFGLDFEDSDARMNTALSTNQVVVGPRVDVLIRDVFQPYASVRVGVRQATARLDDDPSSSNNPNQWRESGAGLDFLAVGGAEVRTVVADPLQVTVHTELGYGYVSTLQLGDLGPMQPGGLVFRTGVGLRF